MSYHLAHRDWNISLKLNHKIPFVFHNLKNYDSHLVMQELGKFNLKISVITNGLEKYLSKGLEYYEETLIRQYLRAW